MAIRITVNGKEHSSNAEANTPLLYVLRDDLELRGPKFGCGLSQCGACSVLVDGEEISLDLLSKNADSSDTEIKEAMDLHLCRCATHNAIVRAIKRAAKAAV